MKHHIPPQVKGKKLDIDEFIEFEKSIEAKAFYLKAKDRLLNISNWFAIASLPASSFEHLDRHGEPSNQMPQEGDFIKIDIPGPGLSSTGGYDYVRIEQISESNTTGSETITMTVRPSSNPDDSDDEETKHFFKSLATSSFQINRVGKTVHAYYYGRNEVINLEMDSLVDRIRNLFVALSAKLGASYPQWKALVKGFLKR
ncbi:hypothetical protein [Sphingobacterium sp. UBA6645]|uniref:hypothetical protein n=1 Tax=Sphingobacterium sp. UBA6645 TaxID=1947511 RepID=UPI0025F060F3|nr:hypothetical protein [Sphingobacterium sp. UBA6645]